MIMPSSIAIAQKSNYLSIIYHLIQRDLRVFKEEFWGKLLDTFLLLFANVVVFGYLLPSYGLPSNYGAFFLIGLIAAYGFFEVIGRVSLMIADMEGDRTILYTLTLPIPSWLVFVYVGVSWSIISGIISLLLFPLGKLVVFSQFDLSKIDFFKLPLIFVLSNLFFGFFALWLSSILKKMGSISHLFVRVVNPMYMFGGFLYSWEAVNQLSPAIGYLQLLNPLLYVMEGMRAATLGPEGYLPFWTSLGVLFIFTLLVGWDAVRRLLKRLDCL